MTIFVCIVHGFDIFLTLSYCIFLYFICSVEKKTHSKRHILNLVLTVKHSILTNLLSMLCSYYYTILSKLFYLNQSDVLIFI